MRVEQAAYRERRDTLGWLYQAFLQRAPAVPVDRLKGAVEGYGTLGRVPLPLQSLDVYEAFRGELEAVFRAADVADATVQAIGSSVNGWRTNPQKALSSWTRGSDFDLAVFSAQALDQCRGLDVPVNDRVILNNEYVILMNDPKSKSIDRNGFYDTPLGARLLNFSDDWSGELGIEVDFKLNLRTTPFRTGVIVIDPARLRR